VLEHRSQCNWDLNKGPCSAHVDVT